MMKASAVLLCLAAAAAAVLVGRQLAPGVVQQADIAMVEESCSRLTPAGFSSYPITRYGELRGCLFVDQTNPANYRVVARTRM